MGRPPPPDLKDDVEDNFTEAVDKASLAYAGAAAGGVSEDVRRVLYDGAADAAAAAAAAGAPLSSPPFWLVVRALRGFAEARAAEELARGGAGHLQLPVAGDLPDMTASSDLYVGLQRVFQAAATADAEDVLARTRVLAGAGAGSVDAGYVRLVCRNARFLRVLRVHDIAGEAAWDADSRR